MHKNSKKLGCRGDKLDLNDVNIVLRLSVSLKCGIFFVLVLSR